MFDRDFLLRAKRLTYAAKAPEATPSRPASHDLHYREGNLLYIETYLGGERFSGEEAVWDNQIPLYAMNYTGRVVGDGFSGDFLKEALKRVPKNAPFRGPESYAEGPYAYACRVEGDVEWFHGYEEITYQDTKVYECYFHGGIVR